MWSVLFLQQQTAYEWRISDWSSDVCSSDLFGLTFFVVGLAYLMGLFILTARRFRSAGISRGWFILTVLAIVIPIGPYYWNVSATAMLLAICAAADRKSTRLNSSH